MRTRCSALIISPRPHLRINTESIDPSKLSLERGRVDQNDVDALVPMSDGYIKRLLSTVRGCH